MGPTFQFGLARLLLEHFKRVHFLQLVATAVIFCNILFSFELQ